MTEDVELDWSKQDTGKPIWKWEPFRIGVLCDTAIGTPPVDHFIKALQLAFDEGFEEGRILKPVELVVRTVNGLPYGDFAVVRQAWNELVEAGCLAVAGPWLSENALALTKEPERDQVPAMSMATVEHWPGHYRFAWQNGDPPQDTKLLADHCAKQGWKRVAVLHEDNNFGDEYQFYFLRHARRLGLQIVSNQLVLARMGEMPAQNAAGGGNGSALHQVFSNALESGADCLIYMGYGLEGARFLHVAAEVIGDRIPKLIGSIFMGCSTPDYGYGYTIKDIEGWIGVDQYDERNPETIRFLDLYEKRYGHRPRHAYSTQGYDWGRTFVEAMSLMRPATPEALRDALEKVRGIPAASGSVNSTISFAPYDHRAYKGDKWVSLSKAVNGEAIKVD